MTIFGDFSTLHFLQGSSLDICYISRSQEHEVLTKSRRNESCPGGTDPELLEEAESLVETKYAVQRLREMATTFGRLDEPKGQSSASKKREA